MISQEQFAVLESKVRKVQRGNYLVSDRVADRVDHLWDAIAGGDTPETDFAFRPWSGWDQALQVAPQRADQWLDDVAELRHLLGLIGEHYTSRDASTEVINAGEPREVEQ